jgi:hypothetical protein
VPSGRLALIADQVSGPERRCPGATADELAGLLRGWTARSRACHRVKQSAGWKVTQPRPGWHQWQTPAGRVYVQEPKRYLA